MWNAAYTLRDVIGRNLPNSSISPLNLEEEDTPEPSGVGAGGWRTNALLFTRAAHPEWPEIPPGWLNMSPAWFSMGHSVVYIASG